MDGKFQNILDRLPEKPPRSRLEPYRHLIDELLRRGRTYRDVASILAEKCQVRVSVSTIHDFVRVRGQTPMFTIRKHCKNRHPSEGAGQIRQAVAFSAG
jgi:hypothetical protein